MPRGGSNPNRGQFPDVDAHRAFQSQLHGQYGVFANAEEMIVDHQSRVNPALVLASRRQIDADATLEALEDKDGAAKKLGLGKDEKVIDLAVRGNALIAVVEGPDGIPRKEITGYTDDWEPPADSPERAELVARAEQQRQIRAEIAQLQADAMDQIEEAAAKIREKQAEAIAKLQEQSESEIAKVIAGAQKQAEKEQKASSSRSSSKPKRGGSRKKQGERKPATRRKSALGDGVTSRTPVDKARETNEGTAQRAEGTDAGPVNDDPWGAAGSGSSSEES